MKKILILISILLSFSFSDPYTIKRISDSDFRYEFYTTDRKIKPKANKIYFWFKGGLIHNAQAGTAGDLLDGKFTKMYHSNQLAEQGEFQNGLKIGFWKTWHQNGVVETTQYWNRGLKTGLFYRYDRNGNLMEKGSFKKNKKHGEWIDYATKTRIMFNKGIAVPKKITLSKEEKKKLQEEKKKNVTTKEVERNAEKARKAVEKSAKKSAKGNNATLENDKPKKESFFKRIFSKKRVKENNNGQGS